MASVAWRNFTQDRTRLAISTGGVAFALLLVLVLDGIFAGAMQKITAYIDNAGAQIFVAQAGVRNMHMATSSLRLSKARQVALLPGVAAVVPILYTANVATVGGQRELVYVIGFDPATQQGGPWQMVAGTAALGRHEAVVDRGVALRLGLKLGDRVEVLGEDFTVAGLSEGGTSIVNSLVFVRYDDFANLRGLRQTASYLLVDLAPGVRPDKAARTVETSVRDVTATPRPQFSAEERRTVRDMSAELIVMMNLVGFLIGMAVTGLTIYAATLAKLREYAVLKAIGAGNRWLYRVVIEQGFLAIGLGFVVAMGLAMAAGRVIGAVSPDVPVVVEAGSVIKVLGAAVLIGSLAAAIPVRQIAVIDPAMAFRQ